MFKVNNLTINNLSNMLKDKVNSMFKVSNYIYW